MIVAYRKATCKECKQTVHRLAQVGGELLCVYCLNRAIDAITDLDTQMWEERRKEEQLQATATLPQ